MSVKAANGSTGGRPSAMQTAKSFSRFEPAPSSPLTRSRASTIQGGVIPQLHTPEIPRASTESRTDGQAKDVFDKSLSFEGGDGDVSPDLDRTPSRSLSLPERFEELPIELMSLTDR